MVKDIAERKDKEMIVVVVKDVKGKNYELPTDQDRKGFDEARRKLREEWERLINQDLIPQEEMKEYEIYNVTSYGLKKWYEIFTERQLPLMCTLLKTIKEVCSEIGDKEYTKAIATYLGFMLCKHIDRNCIGTTWDVTRQKVAHALSFRRPSFCYNFAETNPFEKTSGSLISLLRDIVDAIKFASNNNSRVNVVFGSALHIADLLIDRFDVILTDPPYLDDVPYGEVSEFFYVWLIRLLKEYYPELPYRVPLEEDLVLSKGRFGGSESLAMEFYKRGMEVSLNNIYNVLEDDGLLVVFFAHSSTEAWELLLDILRKTRFREVVKKLTGVSPSVLGPEASFALIGKLFYRGRMPSDEALKAARAYGLSIDSLVKSGYVEKEKTSGGVRIKPFNEARIPNDPSEVDRNNIYEQLLYLEKIVSQRGVAVARNVITNQPNLRVGELRSLVSVLLKHYGLLINKGVELRDDERTEYEVLKTLSDILQLQNPSPRGTTTLDSFL
jgi:hypothetical protein